MVEWTGQEPTQANDLVVLTWRRNWSSRSEDRRGCSGMV